MTDASKEKPLDLDYLISEFERLKDAQAWEKDPTGAIEDLAELYRYAIAHYQEDEVDGLLRALAEVAPN